jgi:hypothetical protein
MRGHPSAGFRSPTALALEDGSARTRHSATAIA